jgi:hypothetical protein
LHNDRVGSGVGVGQGGGDRQVGDDRFGAGGKFGRGAAADDGADVMARGEKMADDRTALSAGRSMDDNG